MRIRPYPAWGLLAIALAISGWRLYQRPGSEYAITRERAARWVSLLRMTTEELDRGLAHRYEGLASALNGAREVGYFSGRDGANVYDAATIPGEIDWLQRYYMAQGLLAPTVLRRDVICPLVVLDCATPEQAERALGRRDLAAVRDFGRGLVLARPEP
jgi:hypothetical protein